MADRRPIAPFSTGDFDYPPASRNEDEYDSVSAQLDRLQRELARGRLQSQVDAERETDARRTRWPQPSRFRRRRRIADSPPWSDVDAAADMMHHRPRSFKRRRLNPPDPAPTFTYGYYGQVEPGRLRLELDSCDGGTHQDRATGVDYGPQNVVKHDKSVYCSQSAKCNLVLRHHDNSAFCLEKLYIVAPENGFSAPVKGGTVYVGMSQEHLQPYIRSTARQHTRRSNPPRSPPANGLLETHLSLLESLEDPEVSRAISFNLYGEDITSAIDSSPMDEESQEETWTAASARDINWPPLEPERRTAQQGSNPEPPSCDDTMEDGADPEDDTHVLIVSDEEITYPEEPTHESVLADRRSRDRRMRAAGDDDDEAFGWDPRYRSTYSTLRQPRSTADAHKRPREEPSARPSFEHAEPDDGVTRARFQITDGKHKVTIKFDPPVAGTHILLKLQSPYANSNIDVQTIIASGYAGPRYFPAVQLV